MKLTLNLEELAMFGLRFLVLIFTPDIGMLGYLVNSKTGGLTYSVFHPKALAISIYVAGIYVANDILQRVGIIFFAHAAFNRCFGYGLKYQTSFNDTHLGSLE